MGTSQSKAKRPQGIVKQSSGEQDEPAGHINNAQAHADVENDGYVGLKAIRKVCNELYANQETHLSAAAPIKSWLGGPDPLDHVEMYGNSGDLEKGVPPHWHYITCGFTDLHGDERVHPVSPYLITDLERPQSIFDKDKTLVEKVNEGIDREGSDLGVLTSVCRWTETNASFEEDIQIGEDSENKMRQLEGVRLVFVREAAGLLPVVIRGRLRKGRLFVYTNCESQAIHFVPPECNLEGIIVNQDEPLKAIDGSLQIYCSLALIQEMSEVFKCLSDDSQSDAQPLDLQFAAPRILIKVVPDGQAI